MLPKAINNNGTVVGSKQVYLSPSIAFRWFEGELELIDGGTSANTVNDAGQIAGNTMDGAFLLDENFTEEKGFAAFGLNQLGVVAGYQIGQNPYRPRSLPYNPAIYNVSDWDVYDIATLYSRGRRKAVYADRYILNGINTGGYAVGYKYRYGIYGSSSILINSNAYVSNATDVVFLPIPAGGQAVDVNDNNIIVGTTGSNTRSTPKIYRQAYRYNYDSDMLTILPLLDKGLHSSANDINELNQVVGDSESASGKRAVMWDEFGAITDLNNMALPEGWLLVSATAINDYGDIVGTATFNGTPHGFLLTHGAIPQ